MAKPSDLSHDRYKWVALTNTTLGTFMATVNSSIILISLPAIFTGIKINPLSPGNIGYLLWILQGYLLVTAVLVVSLGRIGDIFGRVRIFNAGFAVFSFASVFLALDPLHGGPGAGWLVAWRVVQGVGGAMLFANSSAIITDAFPTEQRGLALGINQVAAVGGSFIGLIAGGVLSVTDWRLVFWVSVPFGLLGTVWGYHSLRDNGVRLRAPIDWWGNVTFAVGLTSILVAIVYGIQPYHGASMGWTSPMVLGSFLFGLALFILFGFIEARSEHPMFNIRLFRIRAFTFGATAGLLSAVARGGLQFMLIIWLQGIWLPLHGYSYSDTPLWAGIFLLPLTIGFFLAGPLSGWLSDRHGARVLSTIGISLFALSFIGLLLIPTNFSYVDFAGLLLMNGVGGGMFTAPNTSAIMNSVPANQRGSAGGIQASFLNTGFVLSIGLFFSLMIVGLSRSLPGALHRGLSAHGVPAAQSAAVAHVPAVASLFSSFLGFNPLQSLLGSRARAGVSLPQWRALTGKHFFPSLIQSPFHQGLIIVFLTAFAMSLIAVFFSAFRGERYVHAEHSVNFHGAEMAAVPGSTPGAFAIEDALAEEAPEGGPAEG